MVIYLFLVWQFIALYITFFDNSRVKMPYLTKWLVASAWPIVLSVVLVRSIHERIKG